MPNGIPDKGKILTALSLFWFVPYWRHHRESWQWRERASAVLIVSLATTGRARLTQRQL